MGLSSSCQNPRVCGSHKTLQTMSARPYILPTINLHPSKRMSSRALDLSGDGRCVAGLLVELRRVDRCADWRAHGRGSLGSHANAQSRQLLATRKDIDILQQRLNVLEGQSVLGVPPAQDNVPLPLDAIILAAPTKGPELIWDLPDETPQSTPTVEPAIPARHHRRPGRAD